MSASKLWVDEPMQLVKHPTIIPNTKMSNEELINTVTRIILVVAVVLLILRYSKWWLFLIIGLVAMAFLGCYASKYATAHPIRIENYTRPPPRPPSQPAPATCVNCQHSEPTQPVRLTRRLIRQRYR